MNKLRILNTSAQVLEMILMLKLTNSNISIVFMNFCYIKHYGARDGDDFSAKNN